MSTEAGWDQSGALGIKERRSWQTWQMAVAVLVAIVLGMAVGHTGGGSNSSASSAGTSAGRFVPPPPSESNAPVGAPPTLGTTTSTSSRGAPTSTTAVATGQSTGPLSGSGGSVLLPRTTGVGGQTLAGFDAVGPWKLGWAFQCASGLGFQIAVVPERGTPPSQPAVERTDAQGQGVGVQSVSGRLHLEVRAGPTCRWAVKASGGP